MSQDYLSNITDDTEASTFLLTQLVPYASDVTVHRLLLALAGASSASFLLKLTEQADLQLTQLSQQGSSAPEQPIQSLAEILSTAFSAVFVKYEGLEPRW